MTGTIIQFILLLITHAAAGIYSSTLKYSKKTTYIIWCTWVVLQTALLFYTEFVLTNWALQFFSGFALSLVGQYVIFFATTKGKLAQRVFTMLTYSIFFCIAMSLVTMVNGSFAQLHWTLTTLIQAGLLLVIAAYFLGYVCPLCRTAAKNITTGWAPLIFVNKVSELTAAIAAAEAAANAYTDSKVTELTTAIAMAKSEAISAAETLVNNAKTELQAAIDKNADAVTVATAIMELQAAIDALEAVKDDYTAADAALKAQLEAAIAKAKEEAIAAAKNHIPYIGENGNWWIGDTDTGVNASGIQGETGKDGADGKDGITPKLQINAKTNMWEVSYDGGETWISMGVRATGADGKDYGSTLAIVISCVSFMSMLVMFFIIMNDRKKRVNAG